MRRHLRPVAETRGGDVPQRVSALDDVYVSVVRCGRVVHDRYAGAGRGARAAECGRDHRPGDGNRGGRGRVLGRDRGPGQQDDGECRRDQAPGDRLLYPESP